MVKIYTEEDFQKMRIAGKLASEVLDYIGQFVFVGQNTGELDRLCHEFITSRGAIPAPLNYKGFPKSICTSVNHVVCHGIPSFEHVLREGDIMNIDVTVIVDGYYGDTSRMYYAGVPSIKGKRVSECSFEAMWAGIKQVKPGNTLRSIGKAIEDVAKRYGYSCVRDFCGHGIGTIFHDDPQILHYNDKTNPAQDMILEQGMIFTIEPMINIGKPDTIISKIDDWTATTRDKTLSAQWEHTIRVTSDGYEIFTQS